MKPACFIAFAVLAASPALAADSSLHFLEKPAMNKSEIVFSYAGDLWTVPRSGGVAARLTSGAGFETEAAFSPDGSTIAFTGEYDGNVDVFTIPASGGVPRRITYHPDADRVVGWSPDGKRILFRSTRESFSRFTQLYTVDPSGGFAERLPLPMACTGAYSPDGKRMVYAPLDGGQFATGFTNFVSWKRYRGGEASYLWVVNLSDLAITKVPRTDSNDVNPMWIGDKIYFLSDRQGPMTLWMWDGKSKEPKKVIQNSGKDISSASAGPGGIVYEQFGGIYIYDLATSKSTKVDVQIAADLAEVRPRFQNVSGELRSAAISPNGMRAVFEAHGEILTVPAEKGEIRNLTNTPGVMERTPSWSPDGKSVAYFSDESGEYAMHLRSQDGSDVKKINLGTPSFFYLPVWSPDSKKIVYSDKALHLWYLDIEAGKPMLVDTNAFDGGPGNGFDPAWSPDSKWIAYTRQLNSGMRAVFVYGLGEKSPHQVTDGMSDAAFANFDKNGKYLYFTASTDVGPVLASSMGAYKIPVTRSGYLVVLDKNLKSPLAPQSDEETIKSDKSDKQKEAADKEECSVEEQQKGSEAGAQAKPDSSAKDSDKDKDKHAAEAEKSQEPPVVHIDFENIDQRTLALPFPGRNYQGMMAGKTHVLYLVEGPTINDGEDGGRAIIHKFDICTRKTDKVLENIGAIVLSANSQKVLYEQLPEQTSGNAGGGGGPEHGTWFIKSVDALGKPSDPKAEHDGRLKLEPMEVAVDPRAEWKQMYHEVWRIERDFFYDPNLHGLNLKASEAAYQPFVDNAMSRADLNYIFGDMLGDITAQHVYVFGGDRPEVKHVAGGLLGADYQIDHNRYRFWHVYRGENWNPDLRAPLTEPGVNVKEGEYLLAVNGRELHGTDEIFSFFQETAGKSVQLKVGSDPDGKDARLVTVVPIASEQNLRLRAWMEGNREKVYELSKGRLAYVYLPDTAVNGFTNFNRYYFAQSDRQGAVIDERYNGGGWIADYIVDWLKRPLLAVAMTRQGRDNYIPQTIEGPKAMLINEYAGSGGDALPWMFRRLGTGPLIGTRTWGGLIGIGGYPPLMDGGRVTAPRWGIFNPDTGEFDVENKGVSPDIEVELDPAAWRQGRDPQLEKAVAVVLDDLQQHPPAPVKRPKYPVYNWQSMRAAAAEHSQQTQGGTPAGQK